MIWITLAKQFMTFQINLMLLIRSPTYHNPLLKAFEFLHWDNDAKTVFLYNQANLNYQIYNSEKEETNKKQNTHKTPKTLPARTLIFKHCLDKSDCHLLETVKQ